MSHSQPNDNNLVAFPGVSEEFLKALEVARHLDIAQESLRVAFTSPSKSQTKLMIALGQIAMAREVLGL